MSKRTKKRKAGDLITINNFISVSDEEEKIGDFENEAGESIDIDNYIRVSSKEEEIHIVDIGREDAEDKNKKKI